MKNENLTIKSFNDYFYKQIRIIFFVLVILLIVGNLIDILILSVASKKIIYFNSVSILIFFVALLLHLRFRVSLNICFGICLYTLMTNLVLSQILSEKSNEELLMFFRESIFMILMLIFSGLFIDRMHAVIIYLITIAFYIYEAFVHKHSFLTDNLPILFVVYSALLFVVYFFISKLHNAIVENQLKQKAIQEKNEKLRKGTRKLIALTNELSDKNKALQELNTSKDKFFAILSHDLKNPLNAMHGFSEILINRNDELSPEKRIRYYNNIKDATEKTSNLLNHLLEWSRSQSNILQCDPVYFQVRELAESVCYYLKHVADAKNIVLNNMVCDGQIVFADYNMIFTVLRNFISNSIKFSHKDSEISILSAENNGHIKISIEDQGVGIEKEFMDNLFNIGRPVTKPGTDNETGTGLGLVLCKEFIDRNNGSVGAESIHGKGSTFWFSLPKGPTP
jgi:signal transduction histidine kinase